MTTTDAPVRRRDEHVSVTSDGVPVRHQGLLLVACWDGAIFRGHYADKRGADRRGGHWSPTAAATGPRKCACLIGQRPGDDL